MTQEILRDEIARELLEIDGLVPPGGNLQILAIVGNSHCKEYLKRADRILAIPRLQEALKGGDKPRIVDDIREWPISSNTGGIE